MAYNDWHFELSTVEDLKQRVSSNSYNLQYTSHILLVRSGDYEKIYLFGRISIDRSWVRDNFHEWDPNKLEHQAYRAIPKDVFDVKIDAERRRVMDAIRRKVRIIQNWNDFLEVSLAIQETVSPFVVD